MSDQELAIQVADEIRRLCGLCMGLRCCRFTGAGYRKADSFPEGRIQLIIGTPGRVMDHMRRHTLQAGICIPWYWMKRAKC